MNTELISDVVLAITLSACVSVSIQFVKERLQSAGITLKGNVWVLVMFVLSLIVVFGYTLYYENMELPHSIAIYILTVIGSQGIYQVILDRDTEVIVIEEKGEEK